MRTTVIPQKLGMAQQKFDEFYREHCLTENPNSGEGFSRAISVLWERARLKAGRPPLDVCWFRGWKLTSIQGESI